MSLKVWLPLDGDLRNLGTFNGNFSIKTTLTYTDNGKIGKAYSGGAITMDANTTASILNNQEFSFTCWVYVNSIEGSTSNRNMFFGNSGMSENNNRKFSIFQYPTCNDLHLSWMNDTASTIFIGAVWAGVFPSYKWTHIAVTYKNPNCTIYVNGAKYDTRTGVSSSSSFEYETYLFHNAPNQTRYLNDFRIYDHALSAAEVKEIAMGLVLHYKLDNGSQEIITNIPSTNVYNYPTFDTNSTNGGWFHWGPSGHSGSFGQNTDKKYIYNKNHTYSHWITEDAGTGKYYLLYQSPAFEGGYRSLQAIIKEENGLPITESICYPTWNARNGGVPNNKWTSIKFLGDGFYYCRCEGISQNGSNDLAGIDVMPGYKIYVSECYLEDNTETCSPIFTYSSNIVQDSSGYGHNGTLNSSPTLNTNSPRYSSSSYFSPNIIATSNNLFNQGTLLSEFTWAGWVRRKYDDGKSKAIYSGPINIGLYTDYSLYIGWKSAKTDGTTTGNGAAGGATVPLNTWTHICITYKDGIINFYINGNNTRTFNYSSYGTFIEAFEQNHLGASNWDGDLSDIRIYATALLDTDIKLLYNMGSRIDNLGGVHTFEFEENKSNIFRSELIMPVAKAGRTARIGEIVEHNGYYAMNIAPEPFYKNISDSVSGFLQGYFYTNTSYIFDLWIDVDSVIYNGNNVAGGLSIIFTDGSSDNSFVFTGGNKGWQHKKIITPSNKTIDRLSVWYYTSTDVFYRLDSYICPISSTKIIKQGILDITNITENSEIASIYKGGSIYSSEFIEI